ncbi:uncharacterized protein LOC125232145 isoform X2 [Leguminivora glycinivorella]|uniref:uncharacterized protein LOC125232145 isoform X2 n=1 Tax=Leguminivora glycinivorella TaxID=1035111 RepID=UPI00200EEDBE|nr:uncharacterized protein LOC125232145 isoform X2 [Leguminivora glycinivorella]
MWGVTLLLSGVPQYVTLTDLSYNLDRLFNTDEIGTFKIRDLPNHPQTNRRQIALDFRSSFDAMVAQGKLEGYEYTMEDGRPYTLRAKINKTEEYMSKNSLSPQHNHSWYGADWHASAMIPNLDGEMYHRASARLDAQLELLKKQQLVLEKEKEILREKRRLKQEYGSMHRYDESEASSSKRSRSGSRERRSGSWHRRSKDCEFILPQIEWHDEEHQKKSHSKDTSKSNEHQTRDHQSTLRECGDGDPVSRKESRQRSSREREKQRSHDQRSRSREWGHRDSSKGQTRCYEDCYRNKRSSGEGNYRDLRSTSKERRTSRDRRSRSKEWSSRLEERGYTYGGSRERGYRNQRSTSRERNYRLQRSRSKEVMRWSREKRSRSTERRSRSREHILSSHERRRLRSIDRMMSSHEGRRSRSRDRMISSHERRRSRSKDRMMSSHEGRRSRSRERMKSFHERPMYRRSRSPRPMSSSCERRPKLPAIMPGSPKRLRSPVERVTVSYEDDYIPMDKNQTQNQGKKEFIKVESENDKTVPKPVTFADNKETCNIMEDKSKKQKTEEEKMIAKFNSKVKKADILDARVKEFSKDVMVLLIILLEELMNKDKFRLSPSNKVLLIKKLETIVEERVEPLARSKKSTDVEVLRYYKKLYPREVDLVLIKQMLAKIPKLKMLEPQSTATVIRKVEDEEQEQQQGYRNELTLHDMKVPSKSDENSPTIKQEIIDLDSGTSLPTLKKEKVEDQPIIIDIDSAEKPVPRLPQFVVVLKTLVKQMNKVGLKQLLQNNNLTIETFKFALRRILRHMLKGQGYLPRSEIISKFRQEHPLENDTELVTNIIKDINNGKYPGCMNVVNLIEYEKDNDSPDEVVLVEKPPDVVTVPDSDDEDDKNNVTKLERRPSPNVRTLDPTEPSQIIIPAKPGQDTTGQQEKSVQDMPKLSCPENLNPNVWTIDLTELDQVTTVAKPDQAVICPVKSEDKPAQDMSSAVITRPDKAPPCHAEPMKDATNLACAKTGPVKTNPTKQLFRKEKKKTVTAVDAELLNIESQQTGHLPEPSDNTNNLTTSNSTDTHKNSQKIEKMSNDDTKDVNNKTENSKPLIKDAVQDNLNTQENKDENDNNNPKVTAITIVTSLNDLLAKSTNTNNSEAPVQDIKEELEYEEDRLDESDSGPVVTSITINTSDAELFSIGQDGQKQVNEIKNEEEDAEENLLNEIERDINNDKFSLAINKDYDTLHSIQPGPPKQNDSEINSAFTNDKTDDDDDETIESIGRFVASMY